MGQKLKWLTPGRNQLFMGRSASLTSAGACPDASVLHVKEKGSLCFKEPGRSAKPALVIARRLTRRGVHVNGIIYSSPELIYRGLRVGTYLEVQVFPDLSRVRVVCKRGAEIDLHAVGAPIELSSYGRHSFDRESGHTT